MRVPNPTTYDFEGGNQSAATRVLSDLNKNFGRIFGYERLTQANQRENRKLVIHHPTCLSILKNQDFVGGFKDCTGFTTSKEQFLHMSTSNVQWLSQMLWSQVEKHFRVSCRA
jgi:hypothetical protein